MRVFYLVLLSLVLALPAQAAFIDNTAKKGGFSGPGAVNNTTVQAAKGMHDDARVTLTGNIVRQVGHDKYVFRDPTGEITVEIDDKDFRGQDVTPENTVRISGEVDKDFGREAEIDVKHLDVLK